MNSASVVEKGTIDYSLNSTFHVIIISYIVRVCKSPSLPLSHITPKFKVLFNNLMALFAAAIVPCEFENFCRSLHVSIAQANNKCKYESDVFFFTVEFGVICLFILSSFS
jgi:hypothetical protein